MVLRTLAGNKTIHKLYDDRSGAINKALKTLVRMLQGSQPGVPQTNAVAERTNRDVLAGTRPLLLAAGHPYMSLGVSHALQMCILNSTPSGRRGRKPLASHPRAGFQGQDGAVWKQSLVPIHD